MSNPVIPGAPVPPGYRLVQLLQGGSTTLYKTVGPGFVSQATKEGFAIRLAWDHYHREKYGDQPTYHTYHEPPATEELPTLDKAIETAENLHRLYKEAVHTSGEMAKYLRLAKLFPEIMESKEKCRLVWCASKHCHFVHGDNSWRKLTPIERMWVFWGEKYESNCAAAQAERRKSAEDRNAHYYK
jgi:hypothetical protein